MKQELDALWLSVSPHVKCFDQRLLSQLVKAAPIRRWEYCQTLDEPCCTDSVVAALHEYVNARAALEKSSGQGNYKVHLIGHGVSGVVGLLYARRYPQQVASLTLLSVGAMPADNWQAHYYALRSLLPCSREIILAQMTWLLFGQQPIRLAKALVQLLARDLDSNLTLHSLAHHTEISPGGADVPLLVCNGEDDTIIGAQKQMLWGDATKSSDSLEERVSDRASNNTSRLWLCPQGKHFFHFYHAATVAHQIADHWQHSSSALALSNGGSTGAVESFGMTGNKKRLLTSN
ncbi:MAG: alpha/beta hydrolase [Phormidesmis sp.]